MATRWALSQYMKLFITATLWTIKILLVDKLFVGACLLFMMETALCFPQPSAASSTRRVCLSRTFARERETRAPESDGVVVGEEGEVTAGGESI